MDIFEFYHWKRILKKKLLKFDLISTKITEFWTNK